LEPELGGVLGESMEAPLSLLLFVEFNPSIYVLHAVAQHVVHQTCSLAAIALTATAGPRLARSRRSCAPKYVLLAFKELAAIFKSLSQTILRRSPAFADDFIATDAVVRRKPQPGNKMVCRWPAADVVAASATTVIAVITSMPSIRARSTPLIRYSNCRRSNCREFPRFFLRRPLRVSSASATPALRSGKARSSFANSWSHSAIRV